MSDEQWVEIRAIRLRVWRMGGVKTKGEEWDTPGKPGEESFRVLRRQASREVPFRTWIHPEPWVEWISTVSESPQGARVHTMDETYHKEPAAEYTRNEVLAGIATALAQTVDDAPQGNGEELVTLEEIGRCVPCEWDNVDQIASDTETQLLAGHDSGWEVRSAAQGPWVTRRWNNGAWALATSEERPIRPIRVRMALARITVLEQTEWAVAGRLNEARIEEVRERAGEDGADAEKATASTPIIVMEFEDQDPTGHLKGESEAVQGSAEVLASASMRAWVEATAQGSGARWQRE